MPVSPVNAVLFHYPKVFLQEYRAFGLFVGVPVQVTDGPQIPKGIAGGGAVGMGEAGRDEHGVVVLHLYHLVAQLAVPEAVFRVMDRLLRGHIRDTFPTLRFTAGKTEISLPYSDLVCLTADRNYLVIHSRQKKEYRTRMTLSSVWSKLEQDGRFLQVLRGVIVNMDYITDIADNTCCLQGDLRLPVSVRNRATIEQLWTDYTFSRIRRESMAEGGIRP